LLFTIPEHFLAQYLKVTDSAVLANNAYFIIDWDVTTPPPFILSHLVLSVILRGILLLARCCLQFFNAIASVDIQYCLVGMEYFPLGTDDKDAQWGVI
jgi:hypothetical protein